MHDWPTTLKDAGLRVTAGRVAVLTALADHPHMRVGDVTEAVRERTGSASVQAVYDNLATLHSHGLLKRVEPAGQPPRYELETGDNHHHLVCRACGLMRDVECAVGEAPCLSAVCDDDFFIEEAEVIYWGKCANCYERNQ